MFKRIKVITLLITVLLALGAMQLISAGVFIGALNNDKQNFNVSQLSSQNVAEFTDAWISLNQLASRSTGACCVYRERWPAILTAVSCRSW